MAADPGLNRPAIIYIASVAHSGSTLLGRLLGLHPDVASIGSMKKVWTCLTGDPLKCSCGADVEECIRWSRVRDHIHSHHPTLATGVSLVGEPRAEAVAKSRIALDAIHRVTGAKRICEATHQSGRVQWYVEYDVGDLYVVNLMRDPRATTTSNMRKGYAYLSAVTASHRHARLMEAVERSSRHASNFNYLEVRYEDLCAQPSQILRDIAAFAGLSDFGFEGVKDGVSDTPHMLGGNRMKRQPLRSIRFNADYVESMTGWWAATLLQLPVLLKHGYPLTRAGIIRKWS